MPNWPRPSASWHGPARRSTGTWQPSRAAPSTLKTSPGASLRSRRGGQLRARRDVLASQVVAVPAMPPSATLHQVADHIEEIVTSGSHSQRKALVEALVAQVKITGPDRIVPVFRIPQPAPGSQLDRSFGRGIPGTGVRAMANLVGQVVSSFGTCEWGLSGHPNVSQFLMIVRCCHGVSQDMGMGWPTRSAHVEGTSCHHCCCH